MVQIVNMQPAPSAWSGFGAGMGQGVSQATGMMINVKLNEMLQQKQLAVQHAEWARQGEAIAKMTGHPEHAPFYASVGPEMGLKMLDQLGVEGMSSNLAALQGLGQQEQTFMNKEPQEASQARQMQPQGYIEPPVGMMAPQDQGMRQISQTPSISQQEALQATRNQAQNTALMTQGVAPNIQGIPQSQAEPVQGTERPAERPAPMPLPRTPITTEGEEVSEPVSNEQFRKMLQSTPPKLRPQLLKARQEAQKLSTSKEKLEYQKSKDLEAKETKLSDPYLKTIEEKRASTRDQESSLNLAETALRDRDNSTIFYQFVADKLGFDPLLDENSSLLRTSSKEFILGSLRRAGSRPNMWIEQQIGNMFPTIGKTKQANMSVIEALKFDNKINQKEVEISDRLSDKYKQTLGYIPSSISKDVDKELRPYVEKQRDKLGTRLQEIKEMKKSPDQLKSLKHVAEGTPLTRSRGLAILETAGGDVNKALNIAKKLGYKVPESGEE